MGTQQTIIGETPTEITHLMEVWQAGLNVGGPFYRVQNQSPQSPIHLHEREIGGSAVTRDSAAHRLRSVGGEFVIARYIRHEWWVWSRNGSARISIQEE